MVSSSYNVPNYDTIINVAVHFPGAVPAKDVLLRLFREKIVPHERFGSIPFQRREGGPIEWRRCEATHASPEAHFFERRVSSHAEARLAIDAIINTNLADKVTRPWWEVHLIRWEDGPDSRSCCSMLLRIHHALGDGVTLMAAFAEILTDAMGKPLDVTSIFTPSSRGGGGSAKSGGCGALRVVPPAQSFWRRALDGLLSAIAIARYPSASHRDTPTRLNNPGWPYTNDRIVVCLPQHSVALIRAIREKSPRLPTVNDVEFALLAGMFRRFFLLCRTKGLPADMTIDSTMAEVASPQHPHPDACHMRALTPLAIPPRFEPGSEEHRHTSLLANHWTFIVNDLPVAPAKGADRLEASSSSWSRLKHGMLVPMSFVMHRLAGAVLSVAQQRQMNIDMARNMSVVFSNVPGPAAATFLGGCEIAAVHMIYPNLIPQVGIVSLAGVLHPVITLKRDPAIDLYSVLPRLYWEELVEMSAAAGVDPMTT